MIKRAVKATKEVEAKLFVYVMHSWKLREHDAGFAKYCSVLQQIAKTETVCLQSRRYTFLNGEEIWYMNII